MSRDPYQYFRPEARDLVDELGRGLIALERERPSDVVPRLLRLAHTLKGAARVVRQSAIAERAHALEEALLPLKDPAAVVPDGLVPRVLKVLDAISSAIASLDPATPEPVVVATAVAREPMEDSFRTLRIDIGEMDGLLDGVTEANVHVGAARRAAEDVGHLRRLIGVIQTQLGSPSADAARPSGTSSKLSMRIKELDVVAAGIDQRLSGALDRAERELLEAREVAESLRLLPASVLAASLERTVHDAGQSSGKAVSFETKGSELRLDAQVLARIRGALIQIVRNAVAHGIESQTERLRAGKPPTGRVELEITRRGGRAVFVCRDDGGGIDLDAVRQAAQKKGLSASDALALGPNQLVQLLLHGGVTTSRTVTEFAGRGIGLDIVRAVTAELGGDVAVRTEAGRGTEIELVVPLSLASLDALVMEAAGYKAAVPLDTVRRVMRLAPGDVAQTAEGKTILHEGAAIPFVPLSRSLRGKRAESAPAAATAVVVDGAASLAAVGVDRLLGTASIVVHPVPLLACADALVGGLCIDADGNPQIVLDPTALVLTARGREREAEATKTQRRKPILVVDDSLTTRMLEQSILESAGYEVELAASAEEGLEKASRGSYALFLVDVEMPGMDGFTFVSTTRADPVLRAVPAILVSSRNAPEDLRRGEEAGASAYIVKGDFDQNRLLGMIRRLVEPT